MFLQKPNREWKEELRLYIERCYVPEGDMSPVECCAEAEAPEPVSPAPRAFMAPV